MSTFAYIGPTLSSSVWSKQRCLLLRTEDPRYPRVCGANKGVYFCVQRTHAILECVEQTKVSTVAYIGPTLSSSVWSKQRSYKLESAIVVWEEKQKLQIIVYNLYVCVCVL